MQKRSDYFETPYDSKNTNIDLSQRRSENNQPTKVKWKEVKRKKKIAAKENEWK